MRKIILALCLAVTMAGCVTKSTHTEGDREVNDQTRKAVEFAAERIDAALSALSGSEQATPLAEASLAIKEARQNALQQAQVHGEPEKPAPFSPEASKAARERSTKEHTSGGWVGPVLTVLGAICGIAATCAGMPFLAPIFPALAGKLGKWATTGSQIITAVRAKAEEQGGSIHVQDILAIAKDKNVSAGIQGLVTKHVDAHEEAMGHDFKIDLASDAAEVAAAIAQTP